MKISNLIYINLGQSLTTFLLAVGLVINSIYRSFGVEELSNHDPDVVDLMKNLVDEPFSEEKEAVESWIAEEKEAVESWVVEEKEAVESWVAEEKEAFESWIAEKKEAVESWFVEIHSGLVEKCKCVNEYEEILKYSLLGLVGALILGLLSYFIYIKTRSPQHLTNPQLVLVDGMWIYVERKNDDSSTTEQVTAENGLRFEKKSSQEKNINEY